MLIPITHEKFQQLIPAVATGAQYLYYWGKFSDFLKRLLVSVVGLLVVYLLGSFLGESGAGPIQLILGLVAGLYWLWSPVAQASWRNAQCRRYQYSGLWQGKVLDVFVSDDLIGQEETVNTRGELVIVENRERRLNLQVGDKTGFATTIQVPLKRGHQAIAPGQAAQMLVMSDRPDLSQIAKVSDIYIPNRNLWVSDYPYLQRDVFVEVSNEIRAAKRKPAQERPQRPNQAPPRSRPKQRPRPVSERPYSEDY